jgi:type VI secretion system protein ImpH
MHTEKRRFEPGVIERLFAEPQRFEYFQAVRMLELWLKRHGVPHEGAVANFLRFQNSVSLNFPPSQIEALSPEPRDVGRDARSLGEALRRSELKYIRLTPAFMGMLGMTGSLPAHYTERIAAQQLADKDDGPRAFLDTFSNRALALFYEAWRKYRLELKYQIGGKDLFLPLLLALAGVGNPALQQRTGDDGLLDESLGYFCGAMLHRPTSAGTIARVLSEYFGQPVSMEQFVGQWYGLPLAQQSTLGGANSVLGASADFLPGGKAARVLAKMLAMFTGLTLEYEIELVLRAADVEGIRLDSGRSGGQLGWDCFLGDSAGAHDRRDVRYDLDAA